MQVIATLCVAIIMLATTVEVAHGHLAAAPSRGTTVSSTVVAQPGADCTICFAAHSPAAIFAISEIVATTIAPAPVPDIGSVHLTRRFHFSLFVRPPPLG